MVGMARDVCGELGKRIRELRVSRSWRQLDLATEAGLSENYVSDLELGRKEACLLTLVTLADAFKIKLEVLLKGIGD
jgi:transcriptional regulator with XRE-family HTH domain